MFLKRIELRNLSDRLMPVFFSFAYRRKIWGTNDSRIVRASKCFDEHLCFFFLSVLLTKLLTRCFRPPKPSRLSGKTPLLCRIAAEHLPSFRQVCESHLLYEHRSTVTQSTAPQSPRASFLALIAASFVLNVPIRFLFPFSVI